MPIARLQNVNVSKKYAPVDHQFRIRTVGSATATNLVVPAAATESAAATSAAIDNVPGVGVMVRFVWIARAICGPGHALPDVSAFHMMAMVIANAN